MPKPIQKHLYKVWIQGHQINLRQDGSSEGESKSAPAAPRKPRDEAKLGGDDKPRRKVKKK
jgi:hypothetical protein